MKLADVARCLGATVLTGHAGLDREARGAFAADLLSDVLNRGAPHVVLLTGLTNPQVIRTAEIMDLAGGRLRPKQTRQPGARCHGRREGPGDDGHASLAL